MKIKSLAFNHNESIPRKYTCEGEDLSPPLTFEEVPSNTESIAIIVEDPDAPRGTFDHWIAWNIPGDIHSLPEDAEVPQEGQNDFGEMRYRGPCPPKGPTHHYHFKVYALDTLLDIEPGSSKKELEKAMRNHILANAELIGTYQRE